MINTGLYIENGWIAAAERMNWGYGYDNERDDREYDYDPDPYDDDIDFYGDGEMLPF